MIAAPRDWSLYSGERQTARRFDDIKACHRVRYQWAAHRIGTVPGLRGLDAFCGTGYGTQHLARRTGGTWVGLDGSAESIAFAETHFSAPHTSYVAARFPFSLDWDVYDVVVSFESLEHVDEPESFLYVLARSVTPGGSLILSTPNEALCPLAEFRNKYHVRHFTRDELTAWGEANGLTLVTWCGQYLGRFRPGQRGSQVKEADVQPIEHVEGQNLLLHFVKSAPAVPRAA